MLGDAGTCQEMLGQGRPWQEMAWPAAGSQPPALAALPRARLWPVPLRCPSSHSAMECSRAGLNAHPTTDEEASIPSYRATLKGFLLSRCRRAVPARLCSSGDTPALPALRRFTSASPDSSEGLLGGHSVGGEEGTGTQTVARQQRCHCHHRSLQLPNSY